MALIIYMFIPIFIISIIVITIIGKIRKSKEKKNMGLFSSNKKENLLEKLTKPYIENGFTLSKVVNLVIQGEYFLVDTEHKKFAYTNQAKFNNNEIKIYDFKDLLKYDADKTSTPNGSTSYRLLGGVSTTTNSTQKYVITLYLNSIDINESSLKVVNWVNNSNSINGIMGKAESVFNEMIPVLEYILNNK